MDNRAFNVEPVQLSTLQFKLFSGSLGRTTGSVGPLHPSFSGLSYVRAFYTQFTGGDGISSDTGNTIGREQFVNGHTLYDLTLDLSSSCGHHFSVINKSENLRLELGLEGALSITGNVLVYSEFDNVIEIDKDRKVTRNYEPLKTFDILAMLDVTVLPADQVRGFIDISVMVCNTNPAWIQDNGHLVAMDFTKEGYFLDSFGRSPSYFGFADFINENCATWMYKKRR